jgi:ferric-dicitrate binding protein FerR (iron transport regulator)
MGRRFTCGISAGEAADWLARLRADDRSPKDEAAFRAWLNADPGNAVAFEAVNAIWESAGALPANTALMRFVCSRPRE